jgi:hypothetical protein
MQLIRIEHSSGIGVWRAHDGYWNLIIEKHSQHEIMNDRHKGENFPSLRNDTEIMIKLKNNSHVDYFFSFLSLDQLEQGFTRGELKELILDLDFKVYKIEVSEAITSQYQAIFKLENVISKEDISFMFL